MAGHAGESITHLCAARAIQTQLRNSDGRTFKPNGWHGVSACGRQKLSSVRRSVVQRLQRKPRVAAGHGRCAWIEGNAARRIYFGDAARCGWLDGRGLQRDDQCNGHSGAANGKTVVGRNMWTVETQETKAAEGTFEVKWEGPFVEEI